MILLPFLFEKRSQNYKIFQEEDKNLSGEELGKKLDKLLKQSEEQLQKLNSSSKQLRAHVFGQDRYWRRYWELACAGGIYVEAMESAEPEILDLQAELDEKYKNMPPEEEKLEVKKEEIKSEDTENRENEAPNEVKEEKKTNSVRKDVEELKPLDETTKENEEVNCKKEPVRNCVNESVKSEVDHSEAKMNTHEIKQESKDDVKTESKQEAEDTLSEESCKTPSKAAEGKVESLPNGDKFNHLSGMLNGKELNGN